MTDEMPHLIGLGGKLRSGKDALADYLEWEHGYVKMGMSDALNEALLKLNPIIPTGKYWESGYEHHMTYRDYHRAHGYVEAKKNPEVRRLLQILGTEVGREMIDPDVWVNMAEKKIRAYWAEGKRVVITAMRFPNEIEMLNRLGGVSVWIERPDSERLATGGTLSPEGARSVSERLSMEPCPIRPEMMREAGIERSSGISEHASENSVSAEMFGYTISNNGTLEDLYSRAEEILPGAVANGWGRYEMHFAPPYDR